jgi:CDP-diacylglycerol---serine O-phosphatidyltransferase
MKSKYRFLIPNAITFSSLIVAITAINFGFEGKLITACWLGFLCIIFDKFDGAAARKFNASGNFGMELDSLVDLVAFGVTPAILFYLLIMNYSPHFTGNKRYIILAISIFWVVASALRLAKYNVISHAKQFDQVFQGIPMPMASGLILGPSILLMKYFSVANYNTKMDPRFFSTITGKNHSIFTFLVPLFILISIGMISSFKIPKIKTPKDIKWMRYYVIVNAALTYICVVFRIFPEYLVFIAYQFVLISIYFHFTSPKAKNAKYIPILEVMSWKIDLETGEKIESEEIEE